MKPLHHNMVSTLHVVLLTALSTTVMSAALVDPQATRETQLVHSILQTISRDRHKVLFGQQNPTWYGAYGGHAPYHLSSNHGSMEAWQFTGAMVSSNQSDGLCDVCAIVHDFPAVVGMDLNNLQKGPEKEAILTHLVKLANTRGAVVTVSWHSKNPATGGPLYIADDQSIVYHSIQRILPGGEHYHVFLSFLDSIADWANNLRDKKGRLIPVIFRPWHEATGSWFWWGLGNGAHNSPQDIQKLYQTTVQYLRDVRQVHNFLYAFSPAACTFDDKAVSIYPGDDFVDVLGLDCYQGPQLSVDAMIRGVKGLIQRAQHSGKIAALTEVGIRQQELSVTNWFTQDLLQPLIQADTPTTPTTLIAYMNTWVNWCLSRDGSCQIHNPYPGHPAAGDFQDFYNDSHTMFLSDLRRYASWFYD